MNLQIRQFDPSTVPPNSVVAFIGKRGSGKTTAMRDILCHFRHVVADGVAMCPTEDCTGDWTGHFPPSFVFDTYKPEAVGRMITRQKQRTRERCASPTVLLIDDCMYDKKKFLNDDNMRNVMMNGRHFAILLLMSMQWVYDVTPNMRAQFDYVFLFSDNSYKVKDRIHANWGGMVPTKEAFYELFDSIAQDNCAMVIDCRSTRSKQIEDCIFWYRAVPRAPNSFRVGLPEYWRWDQAYRRAQRRPPTQNLLRRRSQGNTMKVKLV